MIDLEKLEAEIKALDFDGASVIKNMGSETPESYFQTCVLNIRNAGLAPSAQVVTNATPYEKPQPTALPVTPTVVAESKPAEVPSAPSSVADNLVEADVDEFIKKLEAGNL